MSDFDNALVSTEPSIRFAVAKPAATFQFQRSGKVQNGSRAREIRAAVLAYIDARRSLGKTRIRTSEIAHSLELPRPIVEQAVRQLQDEGVKILRP